MGDVDGVAIATIIEFLLMFVRVMNSILTITVIYISLFFVYIYMGGYGWVWVGACDCVCMTLTRHFDVLGIEMKEKEGCYIQKKL